MTLTSIKPYLYHAKENHYAIPLFDAFEMHGAAGIFEAIVQKSAPAIVALYAPHITEPDAQAFTSYLKTCAQEIDIPVSLMLDHGATAEQCQTAIDWGFTDVMFDGSSLPLEENIRTTRQIVQLAHPAGVGVEAELGHVGNADDYAAFGATGQGFTDPDTVPHFIKATGVDYLAIAFGTAHGVSKGGTPKLNLALLEEIRTLVNIPLVMHGGSGLTDAQFQDAIASGISKINVSTNLVNAATKAMKTQAAKEDGDYFSIVAAAKTGYFQGCCATLDLFGTARKAA